MFGRLIKDYYYYYYYYYYRRSLCKVYLNCLASYLNAVAFSVRIPTFVQQPINQWLLNSLSSSFRKRNNKFGYIRYPGLVLITVFTTHDCVYSIVIVIFFYTNQIRGVQWHTLD